MELKMQSNEFRKAYNGYLSFNAIKEGAHKNALRKEDLVKSTFDHLEKGSLVFFDTLISLYGGLNPKTIESKLSEVQNKKPKKPKNPKKNAKKKDVEDVEKTDIKLICAIFWFRVVPKDNYEKFSIPQPILEKKFKKYFGEDCSELASVYFKSNIDIEKYHWIDCRQKYESFCKEAKFQEDFSHDLEILVSEGLLPVQKGKIADKTWATVSNMFGDGKKEDRPSKVEAYKKIIAAVESHKDQIQNADDLKRVVFDAVEVKTNAEFYKKIAGAGGGSPPRICNIIKKSVFDEKTYQNVIDTCNKNIGNKSKDLTWKEIKNFKKYIEKKIDAPFYQNSWSEMLKNALGDIQSKNSRNINFSQEQLSLKKELATLEVGNTLNKYFQSSFFTTQDEFVIAPYHIGGRELPKLFKAWDNSDDIEQCIQEYCDEIKTTLAKDPIQNILRYLHSVRNECNAESILAEAKYNKLIEKFESQSIHPTIKGNNWFTWGDSALDGKVVPPNKRRVNKFSTPDTSIWIEVKLFNSREKRWEKHHVPFFNTQFYEEVYAYNPASENQVLLRTKRFGHNFNEPLKPELIDFIKNSKTKKSAKRIARVEAQIQSGLMPNVEWKDCAICIKKEDSRFKISVIYKFKTQNKTKYEIGDVIVAYDQNQTAAHSYAVLKIVDGTSFRNYNLEVLETGKIESNVSCASNTIDQLSYAGLPFKQFRSWRKHAYSFVKSFNDKDLLDKFKKIIRRRPNLYRFNCDYARLLKKSMEGKSCQELIQKIRNEIIRFLDTKECSIRHVCSLSHDSFSAIVACKAIINAYFSNKLGKCTDEEKLADDPELFNIRKDLERRRKNKGREKINRTCNSILKIAIENNAQFVVGEADLSTGDKNNKKKQNSKNMDWLARGVAKKIATACTMHSIKFLGVGPHYTSHQDALEHQKDFDNPKSVMRARYTKLPPSKLSEYDIKKMSSFLKNNSEGTTAKYYNEAMKDFLKNYNIEFLENDIKSKKIKFWELSKRLEQYDEIIFPRRGGRFYLATHRLTTNATKIKYAEKEYWFSDADEIAAINIGLAIFPTKKSNAVDP